MNKRVQFLYDNSPVPVQNAMLSAYGLYLRRLRYGPRHREVFTELMRSQWLGEDELASRQRRELRRLVQHARVTVPFYATLPAVERGDAAELEGLPLVTKDAVQSAGTAIVSRTYAGARLTEIHTGGTTGKPLNIRCTSEVLQANYAFFSRFQTWTGFARGERSATFAGRNIVPRRGDDSGVYWRRNRAANTLLLSSYHLSPRNIPGYVRALRDFQPRLIDSYPSSLAPIAKHLLEHGITDIRPRAIITSSETLDPAARADLTHAFGCPVFDHYGAAEMAALITQCERGTYHVNPEFGIVELLDERGRPVAPGETGQIVATGFLNDVQPLIRYATGDLAVQGTGRCACGRAFPHVERVIGRMDDVIITPEGRRIGRMDPVFKVTAGLHETQIIQDRRDHVRVEIVTAADFREADGDTLKREIERRLGPSMRVDVVRVPHIQRAASGKLRTVVNLVDRATPTQDATQ